LRAAVTGATGFLGAALLRRLLDDKWDVAALARDPGKLIQSAELTVIEGDLQNTAALSNLAHEADVLFHLAGLTHARRESDYFDVNVEGAASAAKAAAKKNAVFVHVSSLSARAPETSPYARSKLASEEAVATASGANPWVALRLPAIYGPRDRAALPYFKLVRAGFAPEPKTNPPARASILFVEDAVGAILAAREAAHGAVYEVGDERPDGRSWSEIGAALGQAMGRNPRAIRAPRAAVAAYSSVIRGVERALGRNPQLRAGQVREFFHADWVARENLLIGATSWRPQMSLQDGFAKTVLWYQENGLL